jgi:hypothetical protein
MKSTRRSTIIFAPHKDTSHRPDIMPIDPYRRLQRVAQRSVMIDDDECVTILTCSSSPFVPTEPQPTFAHSNSNREESIRARYNREVGCTTELDLPPSSFKMLLSPRLRSLAKSNTDLAMHTVQVTTGESQEDCCASPTSSPENPMSSAFKTLMVFYIF